MNEDRHPSVSGSGSGDANWSAAEGLENSSYFLKLLFENLPVMLAVKDAQDLRFVLGNRAGDVLTGNPRSETLGKTDFDLFPREQAEAFVALDREVLASGELRVIEDEPITTRDGSVRRLRTQKMPVLDQDGRPRYLLAMSEDITERKKVEAQLRSSEALFRSLIDSSPEAVVVIGSDGRIVLANNRVRTMYGYDLDEVIGMPATMLTPPDLLEENSARARAALAAGNGVTDIVPDLTGLRKDGSTFPAEATLSLLAANGDRQVIISTRDVTERKAVETQLRQAQKMEALGSLTGGLAHDFNNLLGVVIGNLDLLRDRLGGDQDSDELAREALSAALRGAELTRRLLAFARRQPLQPRRIDINDLVVGTTNLLRRTLGDHIVIRHELGAAIWATIADPTQLETSIINIVTNARDAMPGGGELVITTANRHLDADYAGLHPELEPGDYTQIEITDTGTGMDEATLGRIFEPFFTTKEEGRGTGLGLSTVFGFIKQSKGHVNVYSEPGRGTTFRLYLPRADAVAAGTDSTSDTAGAVGGGETILAVEDNPSLRQLVVKQLTQYGYRCLEAPDGPSAMKVLESTKIDLLFTDVVMPGGMSGFDLAREALAGRPDLKVLMTSGFPEEKAGAGTIPMPHLQLLSKPYRKEDLARLLREILDS